jgi:hypothetical protein
MVDQGRSTDPVPRLYTANGYVNSTILHKPVFNKRPTAQPNIALLCGKVMLLHPDLCIQSSGSSQKKRAPERRRVLWFCLAFA